MYTLATPEEIEKERADALAAVQVKTDMRVSLLAAGEASDELRIAAIRLTADKRRARSARQEAAERASRERIEATYRSRLWEREQRKAQDIANAMPAPNYYGTLGRSK